VARRRRWQAFASGAGDMVGTYAEQQLLRQLLEQLARRQPTSNQPPTSSPFNFRGLLGQLKRGSGLID